MYLCLEVFNIGMYLHTVLHKIGIYFLGKQYLKLDIISLFSVPKLVHISVFIGVQGVQVEEIYDLQKTIEGLVISLQLQGVK